MRTPKRNNANHKFIPKEVPSTRPLERGIHVSAHYDLIDIRERMDKCASEEPVYINLDVEYWTKLDENSDITLSKADFAFILALVNPTGYKVVGLETICEYKGCGRVIKRIKFERDTYIN